MKRSNIYETLEKIKDGRILKELHDHSNLKLSKGEKKFVDAVISQHKKFPPIFPTSEILCRNLDFLSRTGISVYDRDLIEKSIICKFTFPQLYKKFAYEDGKRKLPVSLERATSYVPHGPRRKMLKHPSATSLPRFYLALVTETNVAGEKVPLLKRFFGYLPHYQTEPLSV